MRKKLIFFVTIFLLLPFSLAYSSEYNSAWDSSWGSLDAYARQRSIDNWTFNEYRYLLSKEYFKLRDSFEIDEKMNIDVLNEMISLAETWYNYLDNNVKNENTLNYLLTAIRKWVKNPSNRSNYVDVVDKLSDYVEDVKIEGISGTVEVNPKEWNAPLNVTLRAQVKDPSWTKISYNNYVWWIDTWTSEKEIWRGKALNYTFTEEWTFSIFLDVVSDHKNENGFTDVLPLRQRVDITVNEKIASLLLKVNGINIQDGDSIKFTLMNLLTDLCLMLLAQFLHMGLSL